MTASRPSISPSLRHTAAGSARESTPPSKPASFPKFHSPETSGIAGRRVEKPATERIRECPDHGARNVKARADAAFVPGDFQTLRPGEGNFGVLREIAPNVFKRQKLSRERIARHFRAGRSDDFSERARWSPIPAGGLCELDADPVPAVRKRARRTPFQTLDRLRAHIEPFPPSAGEV